MYQSREVSRFAQLIRRTGLISLLIACLPVSAFAESGSPLPGLQPYGQQGQTAPAGYSAPVPGLAPQPAIPASAGVPVLAAGSRALASDYRRLPLNAPLAAARLEELRNLMPNSRPKEFQEALGEFCEWLSDMADAHWRMSQSFAKHESTKAQAEAEKQACLKFGQIKRQAMLLKGEFLVAQNRYPEAIPPLIDIVVAEPASETGQNAYRLLKDIGFAQELPAKAEAETPGKQAAGESALPYASVPLASGQSPEAPPASSVQATPRQPKKKPATF